jgi:hypothetical protein
MGLEAPALYDSDESIARQVLDSGHPSLAGITLEALKSGLPKREVPSLPSPR